MANLADPTWNIVGWTAQYNARAAAGAALTPDSASSVDQAASVKDLNNVNGS